MRVRAEIRFQGGVPQLETESTDGHVQMDVNSNGQLGLPRTAVNELLDDGHGTTAHVRDVR